MFAFDGKRFASVVWRSRAGNSKEVVKRLAFIELPFYLQIEVCGSSSRCRVYLRIRHSELLRYSRHIDTPNPIPFNTVYLRINPPDTLSPRHRDISNAIYRVASRFLSLDYLWTMPGLYLDYTTNIPRRSFDYPSTIRRQSFDYPSKIPR